MRFLLPILLAAAATPASAQDAAQPAPNATAATQESPICTDRPTKVFATCTAPAGAIQLETDLVNWTQADQGGIRTDLVLLTNPTLKFGLSSSADIELSIIPYQVLRTSAGGATATIEGVGDLFLRFKDRLTPDNARIQIALLPYVKLPTARTGLGNGRVEGGMAVPIGATLPGGVTLATSPEGDVLLDASGSGHHLNLSDEVNLSRSFGKATFYAELWGDWNFEPAGTVRQYSADVAIAYLVHPRLELDAGANFGLNRATPGIQLTVGVSTRF